MTMKKLKDRYKRYKEWRRQPHQVEPLSAETHECANCGTHYAGNFCPRCGQSAKVGRYSFKNATLLFLDVWGLGSRGIFRTVRDLLLRPGYLIRDYLKGMQMSYYPPFKLFFLLFALSLLIESGLNIRFENRYENKEKEVSVTVTNTQAEANPEEVQEQPASTDTDKAIRNKAMADDFNRKLTRIFEWTDKHISIVVLILLLLFSCPLCLLFRHSPAIPDLRLSECFIAMVYISNMLLVYGLVPSFFCFNSNTELIYGLLSLLLINVPIKQLTGYGYWSTVWRVLLAAISLIVVVTSLVIAIIYLYVVFVYAK